MHDVADMGAISVRDGQEKRPHTKDLLRRLRDCGERCLSSIRDRSLERVNIPEAVAIVLIDDDEIARVHREFMGDPTPTDVITFPYGSHGEILISPETAARQAVEHGSSYERELALYVVHGMLHLCGYEDASDAGQEEMAALQEVLVAECFAQA
jgi:probable rRNA maturation factor